MKEKSLKELLAENQKLKKVGKLLLTVCVILILIVAFNGYQMHQYKEIESGEYITIDDCRDAYAIDENENIGLKIPPLPDGELIDNGVGS